MVHTRFNGGRNRGQVLHARLKKIRTNLRKFFEHSMYELVPIFKTYFGTLF
jgi:hypothetical protein